MQMEISLTQAYFQLFIYSTHIPSITTIAYLLFLLIFVFYFVHI